MLTGRQIFESMGIDPDNYICINFATTGVKSPIGIIEFSGRFGEAEKDFQYFLAPEEMMVDSDLNYAYTRIDRYKYDQGLEDTQAVLNEVVCFLREKPVDIVLVNNEWWLRKLIKEKPNRMLSPLFMRLGTAPVFSLSYYETARVAADYTIFHPTFEYCSEMNDHIATLKKQAPREYVCDIDKSYDIRGGEEFNINNMTASQETVAKMVYIWNEILRNNDAQELYRQP